MKEDGSTTIESKGLFLTGLLQETFESVYPESAGSTVVLTALKGDGSDRKWYRAECCGKSIIVVDHGPPGNKGVSEGEAFAWIGRHLKRSKAPVPEIYACDPGCRVLFLQDCGDTHLQDVIKNEPDMEVIRAHYRGVIDRLILMQLDAKEGFDGDKCLETPFYDTDVILDRESRYFVDAFLNGSLGIEADFAYLEDEFRYIAENALATRITGFLHRDFQSRNILFQNSSYFFIDFQSGRLGPVQYDLASLLIDPYVELSEDIQQDLLGYYTKRLSARISFDIRVFANVYEYNALNRNMQILGAFAYLSRVKKKHGFHKYIPPALKTLRTRLERTVAETCPRLTNVVIDAASKERGRNNFPK
ncbi:MAG: aminoglycoside phosphotransferase family protein [Desulfobacteria bacterium]